MRRYSVHHGDTEGTEKIPQESLTCTGVKPPLESNFGSSTRKQHTRSGRHASSASQSVAWRPTVPPQTPRWFCLAGQCFVPAHRASAGSTPVGIDCHLAGGDLFFAGAVITQLADAQTIFGLHRRSEDAAGHRPRSVQVAHPSLRIEDRARFVIGEFFEPRLGCLALIQNAGIADLRGSPVRAGQSTRGRDRGLARRGPGRSLPIRRALAATEARRAD